MTHCRNHKVEHLVTVSVQTVIAMSSASSSDSDSGEPPVKVKPPVEQTASVSSSTPSSVNPVSSDPDFTIMNDEQRFPVHKHVITKKSHYFNALLEGATFMKEAQSNEVDLKAIDTESLSAAIDCMYDREIHITLDNVMGMINAASHLQIDVLLEKCCQWLVTSYTLENAMFLYEIALTYSLNAVIDSLATQFAADFDTAVHKSAIMFQVEADFLGRVISSDSLHIRSERYLLSQMDKLLQTSLQSSAAGFRWSRLCLRSGDHTHSDCVNNLLKHIRFCLMSHSELMLLQLDHYPAGIQHLIKSAIQYHSDFTSCLPVKVTEQSRVRSTTPTLVLTLQSGNGSHVHEILACIKPNANQVQTDTYSLQISAALHRICGVATLDNMLYTVSFENYGGFDYDSFVRMNCYDPCIGQQRPLPPPKSQIIPPDIAVLGRKLYLCGGVSRSNTVYVPNCEVFDVDTLEWSSIPDLPQGRNLCASAGLRGKVYVSGGLVMRTDREVTSQLLALNTTDGTEWVEMTSMNVARRGHSMVTCADRYLIVCGGLIMRPSNRRDGVPLERYDVTTNQWTEIISCGATLPGSSLGHYTVLPDRPNILYALGHERSNAQEHEIWCTDIDEKNDLKDENETYLQMALPSRYKLHHAFAAYLYLNINDQTLQGKKNPP